jgi:ABC-type transporter Mla subunit MlaD
MDDSVFRIVVTIAVVLACISFLIQAGAVLALVKIARALQAKVNETMVKVNPVLDTGRELMAENRPRINEITQNVVQMSAKVSPILDTAREIINENRPKVAEVSQNVVQISANAAEISRSARDQVARIGDVVRDTSVRAKTRVAQVDESIDYGIERAERAGETARAIAMKPLVQAQGVLAAVRAAVAAYSNSGRRSSIETATQDEEMFI